MFLNISNAIDKTHNLAILFCSSEKSKHVETCSSFSIGHPHVLCSQIAPERTAADTVLIIKVYIPLSTSYANGG